MSATHKAALAEGRHEGRVVRRYLEALDQHRPKRGRKRTTESVRRRLATVTDNLVSAEPLARLHLLQEKADLEAELARASSTGELVALETAFVAVAETYGRRKGIGYNAWRAAGVSAAVLQRAHIRRAPGDGTPATTTPGAGASAGDNADKNETRP